MLKHLSKYRPCCFVACALLFVGSVIFTGCGQKKPASDEEFVAAVQQVVESPAPAAAEQQQAEAPVQVENPKAALSEATAPVAKEEGKRPRIRLETEKHVMQVPSDKVGESKIKVFNDGDEPLEITEVKTTCGCTTGSIEKNTVAPGGFTHINVKVDPFRIRAFETTKVLTVHSNDPDNPAVRVSVESHVDPEFEIEPREIDFGNVEKGKEATQSVIVRKLYDGPLEVTGFELAPANPNVAVSFQMRPESEWKTPGKTEYELSATLLPSAPVGVIAFPGRMSTNLKRLAMYTVYVKGNVTSFYSLRYQGSATRPVLPTSVPGQQTENVITIISEEVLKVENIESTDKAYTFSARPVPEKNWVAIDFVLAEDATVGRHDTTLTFTISSPTESVQESIQLFGIVTTAMPNRTNARKPLTNLNLSAPRTQQPQSTQPSAPQQAPVANGSN